MGDVNTGQNPEVMALYDESGNEVGSVLSKRFGVVTGSPQVVTTAGSTVIYTPPTGGRIRLKWLGLSTPSTNSAPTEVQVFLGNTLIYWWSMGAPGAFAHSSVREGAADEKLTVACSTAQRLLVNFDLETFV